MPNSPTDPHERARQFADIRDHARAWGWQVTQTPSRLGLSGRSYRDSRFAARRQARQDTSARTDQRHE